MQIQARDSNHHHQQQLLLLRQPKPLHNHSIEAIMAEFQNKEQSQDDENKNQNQNPGSSSLYHRSSLSNRNRNDHGFANVDSVSTTKGKTILHQMDLWFPEGCITAILGPSGAGKSTLLQLLTDSLPVNAKGAADGMSVCLLCVFVCV